MGQLIGLIIFLGTMYVVIGLFWKIVKWIFSFIAGIFARFGGNKFSQNSYKSGNRFENIDRKMRN